MTVDVRAVGVGERRGELVALCSRAFWDDPLFDFLAGDDLLVEYALLPRVFQAAFRDFGSDTAARYVVDIDGRPRCFAAWLAPGRFPRARTEQLRRELRSAALLLHVAHRQAAVRLLREVDRRHPHEPHWYLGLLATDPSAQGRGLGSTALRPILERCDTEGLPAYTETQKESNVSWYARSGFQVLDTIELPSTPPIWRLWRDPR